MRTWTVIGFYEDEDQAFADHVEADDQYQAMAQVGSREDVGTLVLVGAIEGEHQLLTPGDDNRSICYASEMHDLFREEV